MRRTVRLTTLVLSLLALGVAGTTAATASAQQRLVVTGAGFGHGVGMSQYGAWNMAMKGAKHGAILKHYYRGTQLGRTPRSAATVRVLLAEPLTVTFSGATRAGGTVVSAGTTYSARIDGGTVVVDGGGREVRVAAPARISGRGPLQVGVLGRYRGALELRPAEDDASAVQVVNAVGLEDYVRGVLADEMPGSWAIEALKAQAVAARTYSITTNKDGPGYDHYADTRSQMYGGVAAESARTDLAVAATRERVVTYRGRPVATYFMASSGGRTESAANAFGSEPQPWLVSVADPADRFAANPYRSWTRTFTLAEAERRLGDLVQGSLRAVEVTVRGDSPRVLRARVVGTDGSTTTDGATLRARLDLPDTWARFTVR
ncbi:SpoIID/LytB domain-containing protein [Conexibacter woesei]|nr:SpoIID/LytB domain-containing protein [Conexibacter woesei]